MIGFSEERHADQLPVGAITPAMVGAGEDGGVALVVAAYLHPAMAARIEEDMHLAGAVAAQDDGFLAHPRGREIAGVGDLALMPDEEPRAGKDPLLLLGINLLVDEDLAADLPGVQINEAGAITGGACRCHACLPNSPRRYETICHPGERRDPSTDRCALATMDSGFRRNDNFSYSASPCFKRKRSGF